MDMKALAEAACMFSTAAYETTYGNWVFDPDEYDDTIAPDELEDALWQVGGYYLLEVERYDGRFDLTVSTYYTKDEEDDGPFDELGATRGTRRPRARCSAAPQAGITEDG